jgi:hypothetical protein
MTGPYNTVPVRQVALLDFGPGQSNDWLVFHNGQMVVLGERGDPSFKVPNLIQPQVGIVDVVIHGVPGRFSTRMDGEVEIPPEVVAQLLDLAGIQRGTPLRCLTCWGAENPLTGQAAGQRLATQWNSPVSAPDGLVVITLGTIRIHVGDWHLDPVFGGQQFTVRPAVGGQPSGYGQGGFVPFSP